MISKPINNLIAAVCEMQNMKTHNIFVQSASSNDIEVINTPHNLTEAISVNKNTTYHRI